MAHLQTVLSSLSMSWYAELSEQNDMLAWHRTGFRYCSTGALQQATHSLHSATVHRSCPKLCLSATAVLFPLHAMLATEYGQMMQSHA